MQGRRRPQTTRTKYLNASGLACNSSSRAVSALPGNRLMWPQRMTKLYEMVMLGFG